MKHDWGDLLSQPATQVAPRLLGSKLKRTIKGRELVGKIVEVEAYDQSDMASHSYKGRTERTDVMFGSAGHLYVYFTYGMHYCCNVVTGPPGHGAAVLIRAIEPLQGESEMEHNRQKYGLEVSNGPAKLCQALQIDKQLNGHYMEDSPLELLIGTGLPQDSIVQTTRIGISKATDQPWRFYIRGNKYVSKL